MSYSRPYNYPLPVIVTASKTIALTDTFTLQLCTNTAAITITIPLNSTLVFPLWTNMEFAQDSTGSVTFAQAAAGVNIRRLGNTNVTGHQILGPYGSVLLRRIDVNEWRLYGSLA